MTFFVSGRQHLWHLSAVDLSVGVCLILIPEDNGDNFQIVLDSLSNYLDKTFELIGTHVNGNPYSLGSKKYPLHLLVQHGCIPIKYDSQISLSNLHTFFSEQCVIEGIVWHCRDGSLYKVHCHHLNLKWPPQDKMYRLTTIPTTVRVDSLQYETDYKENTVIQWLTQLSGKEFDSLCQIQPES